MRSLITLVALLGVLMSPTLTPAQPPPSVVTLDKLTEYLSLGVPETKLLKLLADSPSLFVLGQAEEAALRKAGATEALIAAIKAKASAAPQPGDIRAFVVILDVSGSMADKDTSGVPKWGPAQKAAIDLVSAIPDGRQFSLIVYGHDAKRECEAVDVVQAMAPTDASTKDRLKKYIEKLKPAGHTPIATALKMAGGELRKADGLSKVILITDGVETCHGDPNKEAGELAKIDTFRGVDVVGLDLNADESKAVAGIARAGKGRFYDAKTAADLTRTVSALAAVIKQPEPPKADRPKLSLLEEALVEKLTDKDWKVRKEACDGLAGRKCKAAAPAVADFVASEVYDPLYLTSGSEKSRDAALAYLMVYGKDELNDALIKGMKAKRYEVRAWCGLAAGTVTPLAKADGLTLLDKALVGLLADESWAVRKAGCDGLRGRKCKAAAPAVADFVASEVYDPLYLTSGSEKSRDAAVEYLQAVAPDQTEAALARALRSPKPEVKAWAGRAAANLEKK